MNKNEGNNGIAVVVGVIIGVVAIIAIFAMMNG